MCKHVQEHYILCAILLKCTLYEATLQASDANRCPSNGLHPATILYLQSDWLVVVFQFVLDKNALHDNAWITVDRERRDIWWGILDQQSQGMRLVIFQRLVSLFYSTYFVICLR